MGRSRELLKWPKIQSIPKVMKVFQICENFVIIRGSSVNLYTEKGRGQDNLLHTSCEMSVYVFFLHTK